jgi:SAM-dependent methyltransferase
MTGCAIAADIASDFEFAALEEARNYRQALLRDFREHLRGNVLEVGAGVGQMSRALMQLPEILELLCVEPDASFCERLRAVLPAACVHQGTAGDLLPGTAWNAVVSINVLEHIERDEEELAAYHRLLAPAQGALCLFVPARPELYAPIDRDFGHFRRYIRSALRTKLESAGFKILRLHYCNLPGYFAWGLNFRLLGKRSFDPAAVRFFDRMIFPLVHGFESRICPPPIGQSLLAIAVASGG